MSIDFLLSVLLRVRDRVHHSHGQRHLIDRQITNFRNKLLKRCDGLMLTFWIGERRNLLFKPLLGNLAKCRRHLYALNRGFLTLKIFQAGISKRKIGIFPIRDRRAPAINITIALP
ncbi:hypothetical protein H8K29_10265 [Undibacterium sp. CY21W]|nr:hypothetical protein [Undibacterium sp. CY21W]MBC3928597.1 hypothetical protein [Undibacterium sp. CY21W]